MICMDCKKEFICSKNNHEFQCDIDKRVNCLCDYCYLEGCLKDKSLTLKDSLNWVILLIENLTPCGGIITRLSMQEIEAYVIAKRL
jgi:hypothetical protein